jgi:hypothetical protein
MLLYKLGSEDNVPRFVEHIAASPHEERFARQVKPPPTPLCFG